MYTYDLEKNLILTAWLKIFDKYVKLHKHIQNDTEHHLMHSCCLPAILTPKTVCDHHWSIVCAPGLSFPNCYINGITKYVISLFWLPSYNNIFEMHQDYYIHSQPIHFIAEYVPTVLIIPQVFLHPLVDSSNFWSIINMELGKFKCWSYCSHKF